MSRRGNKSNKKYIYLGIIIFFILWVVIASQKILIKPTVKEDIISLER